MYDRGMNAIWNYHGNIMCIDSTPMAIFRPKMPQTSTSFSLGSFYETSLPCLPWYMLGKFIERRNERMMGFRNFGIYYK